MHDYIKLIYADAEKEMTRGKILASLTIAQSILESGWGTSKLTKIANNSFGIKADAFYQGNYITMETFEYLRGEKVLIKAKFRKYKTLGDSLQDHTNFLLTNSRYKNIIDEHNYEVCCTNIYKDGYATDIDYTGKLLSIIEKHKLYIFDLQIHTLGVIKMGMRGTRIKVLQNILNKYGYKLLVDGVFHVKTLEAVKHFQLQTKCKIDGIVGIETIAKF